MSKTKVFEVVKTSLIRALADEFPHVADRFKEEWPDAFPDNPLKGAFVRKIGNSDTQGIVCENPRLLEVYSHIAPSGSNVMVITRNGYTYTMKRERLERQWEVIPGTDAETLEKA